MPVAIHWPATAPDPRSVHAELEHALSELRSILPPKLQLLMDQIPHVRMLCGDQCDEHAVWRYHDCTNSLVSPNRFVQGHPCIYLFPGAACYDPKHAIAKCSADRPRSPSERSRCCSACTDVAVSACARCPFSWGRGRYNAMQMGLYSFELT